LPWLIAIRDDQVVGFAYANKWKTRAAYRFATEVAIYVREGLDRSGIRFRLYAELFAALKSFGAHAVIGGVALPNEASLRLHQKFGFEKVAHFKESM
jgi:L-amino acid N-acyltransferase YncA